MRAIYHRKQLVTRNKAILLLKGERAVLQATVKTLQDALDTARTDD